MTAEVAVINRSAVALAADSAVTLPGSSPGAVDKIFQNENKLFELSKSHPIGVMLYNATSLFQVSWEIIIKEFRLDCGGTDCAHVFEWPKKFRDYITSHPKFLPSEASQKEYVLGLLKSAFGDVRNSWRKNVEHLFFSKQTARIKSTYPEVMTSVLESRIKDYRYYPFFEGHDDTESANLLAIYDLEYTEAKKDTFGSLPLDAKHQHLVECLAKCVLSRSRPSGHMTGLVFAGFGNEELFPSLVCIELSGIVNNKMRWVKKNEVDIDRSTTTAEVIPFAQRDTVDTLVFERSNRYEWEVAEHFSDVVKQMGNALVKELAPNKKKKDEMDGKVESFVQRIRDDFFATKSKELRDVLAEDTLDIVRHMPKPDLAAFAESLVTVSSMKRKVTVGPETVGGPVDVAVISKHEGFIWVKRKRYFDPDLNRRYMSKIFGSSSHGGSNA